VTARLLGVLVVVFLVGGYLFGPLDGFDALILLGLALVAAIAVGLWLRPRTAVEPDEAGVLDERTMRRAVRRGVLRSGAVAFGYLGVALVAFELLVLASSVWQERGDREVHFRDVALYGFAAGHAGFRSPSGVSCCNASLRSLEVALDTEPKTASLLAQPVHLKIRLDLRGRISGFPLADLPETGVDIAAESPARTKQDMSGELARLPAGVVATADVELRRGTPIAGVYGLLARHGLVFPETDQVAIYLEPQYPSENPFRHDFSDETARVSWPRPSIAQFQAWVKTLRPSDDEPLQRLELPPRRVLRAIGAHARVYGLVLDRARPRLLRGLLAEPAVRMVEVGDVAFDLGAAG